MSFVAHLLFNNTYTPPPASTVRSHRIMNQCAPTQVREPVQARTKIMATLSQFNWMTAEEIALKTGLTVATVARTTDRMYASKRIERKLKTNPAHGKINIYRKK